MKRPREQQDEDEHPAKVLRIAQIDRLSELSDELLVRILSFLPVSALLISQRISKKYSRLATDSELWKAAFYRTFVLPRASRIPGIKTPGTHDRLHYSSRVSRWLDDGALVKNGAKTNWKQQYRLRHNWSHGKCALSEITVSERSPQPPLLVKLSNSTVFAADSVNGLRAWNLKAGRELLGSTPLSVAMRETPRLPVSMSTDSSKRHDNHEKIALGFQDGSFSIFTLCRDRRKFDISFTHPPSSNGKVSALALSWPYLLTMTEDHLLSLYAFTEAEENPIALEPPRLLYSLQSYTAWPPVSLSLRTTAKAMTAAIAYSLPTYLSGWTVGVQELNLSHQGELLGSRLASAADEHAFTLSACRSASSLSSRSTSPVPGTSREDLLPSMPSNLQPTSMSYSHPYLLVAHPDNTMSLYLVKSSESVLCISSGNRLWGHTSAISGAHVGMRGKAVSVSRFGDELRVWDLEGGTSSLESRRRFRNGELSVRVRPSRASQDLRDIDDGDSDHHAGLRFALDQKFDDSSVNRGWVGFDEQNVLVLREREEGSQALVVHDFS